MAKKPRVIDALSPLDSVTSGFMTAIIVLVGFFVVVFAADQDATAFGMSGDQVCVESSSTLGVSDSADLPAIDREALGLAKGVQASSTGTQTCQADPSLAQNALAGSANAPSFLVFVGFLAMTRRTITHARRSGLFSTVLARRVERMGWLVVLGLVLAAGVEWAADGMLRSTMDPDASWVSGSFSISVIGLIGAYGIVSIGRVMQRAAELQTDADGTI